VSRRPRQSAYAGDLKSLELLAHAGSIPAPGTNALVDRWKSTALISVCEKTGEDQHPLCYGSALRLH